MANKVPAILITSAAAAALVFTFWPSNKSTATLQPTREATAEQAIPEYQNEAPTAAATEPKWSSDEERNAFFVADMQSRFAPHIHIQHAQIRFLEQLISYLKAHYPDDWRERVAAFLNASFPELAASLQNKFESLERYNEWLLVDRKQLQQMTPEERRQALWDKRYAAFGEDAEKIWAAELRNQKISETLARIDQDKDADLQTKLDALMDSVQESYGEHSDKFIETRQTELLSKFVELPSVQSTLRAMPAPERRRELRKVRAALGMNADALDRWENLDEKRDIAWEAGQTYMAERQKILSEYDGHQQEQALYALQNDVFGHDAELIRQEETAGFYRYKGERRIGRE
ncbi:hypothetical protein [Litorivivens sp.]|uniref:hypothetical protein n=1 Tax=Litorivivens sp. TaxID=2020868 RepID=UPI003567EBC5